MCHCQPAPATTYYHVTDQDNGDHIATYTNRHNAYRRATHEALNNGRDFCTVSAGPTPPSVTINGTTYYDGELISEERAA